MIDIHQIRFISLLATPYDHFQFQGSSGLLCQNDPILRHIFYPFRISALLGENKFVCGRCFEIIGKYSAAACTRPGAFLEQVISTSGHRAQKLPNQIYTGVLQQHRRLFSATIFDFYWIFKRHVLSC